MKLEKSIIQKVVFDVDYFEKDSAISMQNRIFSEFNNSIEDKLKRIVEEYTKGFSVRINKLEIDLGIISKKDCEFHLPSILTKELETYFSELRKKIELNNIPTEVSVDRYDDLIYDYLVNFLKYGRVPWNLQIFGEEETFDYWLFYLAENNQDLFKELLPILSEEDSRNRLMASLTIDKFIVFKQKMFGDSLSVLLKEAKSNIQTLFEKAGWVPNDIFLEKILNNFVLFSGYNLIKSGKHDISTKEMVDQFVEFIKLNDVGNIRQLLKGRKKPITSDNAQIFRQGKNIVNQLLISLLLIEKGTVSAEIRDFHVHLSETYFKNLEEIINYKFDLKEGKILIQYTSQWFDVWLQKNQTQKRTDLIHFSHLLTDELASLFPSESKGSIEKLVRSIMVESLERIHLPGDINLWISRLQEKLITIFGVDTQTEISGFISKQVRKVIKIETVEDEFKDSVLAFLTVDDGDKKFRLKVSVAFQYLNLLAEQGIVVFHNIFQEPVSVLHRLFELLEKTHPSLFIKEFKEFANKISPLIFKELSDAGFESKFLSKILASSKNSFFFKEEIKTEADIGRLLLIDIFIRGYISILQYEGYGVISISKYIKEYVDKQKSDFVSLIRQHGFSLSSKEEGYLSRVTDSYTCEKIKEIFTETSPKAEKKEIEKSEMEFTSQNEFARLQLAIILYLQNSLNANQIEETKQLLQKLIDSKSLALANIVLSISADNLEKIKNILESKYRIKIENLVKSFKYRYMPDDEEKEKEVETKYHRLEEGEPIYVNNAGLILLNPYFLPLFTKLELVKDKKFVDGKAKIKAIQLMQYLVTKMEIFEEPDLMLNKVLVGMEIDEPINEFQTLSDKDKEMCQSLLKAVIQHWKALKSSSDDNLRGSFLFRNGRLTFEQSNWRLSVEKKAYDILLDKLPWTYSMVKLPWMKYALFTEWG